MLEPNVPLLRIVEGASSTWAYHLSTTGKSGRAALCGKHDVMSTALRLSTWNSEPSHIPSSYCAKCSKIARELGISVSEATEKTKIF